ncbi:type II toxin-antitoxin system RatA family toxin [Alkalicaulis satelles]|uniref:Type II toxin-antitoxin system RatA family toxin n=1 Tax=Alkalicaulis satelles TaxID=2609175 RepID=A0A5M6ZJ64_9PROT|nr:type II toxin-antitoxin system RatA family toxin [Alkalicaulis satelles]KAA5804856.1 type II toxin-antitoxin system RatA family toxin [Alkalicaulis satelles]
MAAEHVERLRLRHRPDDLFDLVSDVRAYPRFIPLISAMRVTREDVRAGVGELDAEARVRFRFVRERFTTRVTLDRPGRRIDVAYLSGPFDDLANQWRFHALEDGSTLVDFWIRYHFRNPLLQMLVDTNRSRAIRFLVNAFQTEARARYETVGASDYALTEALGQIPAAGR